MTNNKPAPHALPTRQKETLDYIKVHILAHDQSPTYDEIAEAIGSRKQHVKVFCDELQKRGFITRSNGHRSIVLV